MIGVVPCSVHEQCEISRLVEQEGTCAPLTANTNPQGMKSVEAYTYILVTRACLTPPPRPHVPLWLPCHPRPSTRKSFARARGTWCDTRPRRAQGHAQRCPSVSVSRPRSRPRGGAPPRGLRRIHSHRHCPTTPPEAPSSQGGGGATSRGGQRPRERHAMGGARRGRGTHPRGWPSRRRRSPRGARGPGSNPRARRRSQGGVRPAGSTGGLTSCTPYSM